MMNPASVLGDTIDTLLTRPTWVEVDLDAIDHNVRTVKAWLAGRKLIGVLKGDACGFGTAECGVAMERAGVDMLAVGNPFEIPVLRRRGVRCPILLFASYTPLRAREIAALDAILTIVDRPSLEALASAAASSSRRVLDVFIKIDTGLGRLGVPFEHAVSLIEEAARNPAFRLLGVYSHAGSSSEERAEEQLARMNAIIGVVEARGIDLPFRVLASTPLLLRNSRTWLNAVDPGRLLFGILQPPGARTPQGSVRPALRALRTRLIQLKAAPGASPSGYSASASGKTRTHGVLPFGWTDGFLPDAYRRSGALLRGVRVPFVKPLSAEHSVIDVSGVPDAAVGDIVTLLGHDGGASIDVGDFASDAGLAVSDVTRRFHRHLPYVYFEGGVPVRLKTLSEERTSSV